MRIVACGHTIAHLPQSIQMSGSQIGISLAIARFSYCEVDVGNVPSTGSALTGRRSPSPAINRAVTLRTNSLASGGTVGATVRSLVTRSGTVTRCRPSSARSMAAKLRSTIARPRRPYVRSTSSLICAIASSGRSTPESWKKQGCMIVLIRFPMPTSRAIWSASMTHTATPLSMICCWTSTGIRSHTSCAENGLFSRNVAPGFAYSRTFTLGSKPN